MKKRNAGEKDGGITLKCIEKMPALFESWQIQYDYMLKKQQMEQNGGKADCDGTHFLCLRCGKKIPYADGGAVADIRYDKCWSMILKQATKKHDKVAICIPCLIEVLPLFGFTEKDILKWTDQLKPKYIKGEYVLVDTTKDKPKPNTKGTDNMKAKADTATKPKRERKRKPLTKEKVEKEIFKIICDTIDIPKKDKRLDFDLVKEFGAEIRGHILLAIDALVPFEPTQRKLSKCRTIGQFVTLYREFRDEAIQKGWYGYGTDREVFHL